MRRHKLNRHDFDQPGPYMYEYPYILPFKENERPYHLCKLPASLIDACIGHTYEGESITRLRRKRLCLERRDNDYSELHRFRDMEQRSFTRGGRRLHGSRD